MLAQRREVIVKDHRLLSRSSSWLQARRRQVMAAAACGLSAAMVLLAGCGPVKLIASTNIPPPLVVSGGPVVRARPIPKTRMMRPPKI